MINKDGSICYCMHPKTVNTKIISGMLLCCKEKANQRQDEKTADRTIKMAKSNQSVHGFWIRTVR